MQLVGDRTLTSVAGSFTFDEGTRLSHAKLVRDTVTAGHLGALRHTPRPQEQSVVRWFKENVQGNIGTELKPFKWVSI